MCLLLAWGRHMPPKLCMCRRREYGLAPYIAPHTHREALGMLRHYSLRFAVHVAGLLGSSLHSKCAPENPGHWSPGHPLGLYPHAGAGRL